MAKNNILVQSGVSVLSQANNSPAMALKINQLENKIPLNKGILFFFMVKFAGEEKNNFNFWP